MNFKQFAFSVLLGIAALQSLAQVRTQEFGFQSDNDSFLAQGSDRYYTNGLFVFYRRGMDIKRIDKLVNKVLTIEVGQKIFNPQSGSITVNGQPNPAYIDRPFAGYLYAGGSLNLLYRNESNFKIGVQVGVIGPSAKGEQAQQVIHDTFGFYELSGWEYQIRNTPVINLSLDYNRLLARNEWIDLTASGMLNAGTAFNNIAVGPMVRLGNFNQLFNSYSTQSTATRNAIAPLHKKELFFYYKPMFNYIAYDATVQGALVNKKDDPTGMEVTGKPEPIMISHQIGVGFSGKRVNLGFEVAVHSKDVKTQRYNTHQWGSINVAYRFGK
ncbi:lipid A deacylase LpxR family protein [Mucilaginibacter terrae]|uniref:Lipid A 3-O-deacylase n=1 Tax=Mucilaginibacter terrae TaxID=1955052 RepID=A0ABU3GYJ9_9SPHI|nr:lipid A deacylase LpxR family protein [Mucilaginibacter terrae]MDT3404849.1 lipid A 3-O-deacylase [Mucilaginibacter terrae]